MQADIERLKELVSKLEYTGDNLAFDKMLGAIDLVIYELRQQCFTRPRVKAYMDNVDNLLKDLLGD